MVTPDVPPIVPVILEGTVIRLEPLSASHVAELCQVGLVPALWEVTVTRLQTAGDMKAYVDSALRAQSEGSCLPFSIVHKQSGRLAGSTRYGNIDRENRRVEIGWTWVAPEWQRTAVNTDCKYVMLRHAFEVLRCIRVEFKTDVMNARSRQALLRIGAKEEGVLRNHMIVAGGRIRDTVYYSIIAPEWPEVKKALEARLGIE